MVNEFKIRRDYIVKKINDCNMISCAKPAGAFYIMVNISKIIGKIIDGTLINNSIDFAKVILDKEKVAVIPGDGFGASSYIRLSYATSIENIKEGIKRLINFVEN